MEIKTTLPGVVPMLEKDVDRWLATPGVEELLSRVLAHPNFPASRVELLDYLKQSWAQAWVYIATDRLPLVRALTVTSIETTPDGVPELHVHGTAEFRDSSPDTTEALHRVLFAFGRGHECKRVVEHQTDGSRLIDRGFFQETAKPWSPANRHEGIGNA